MFEKGVRYWGLPQGRKSIESFVCPCIEVCSWNVLAFRKSLLWIVSSVMLSFYLGILSQRVRWKCSTFGEVCSFLYKNIKEKLLCDLVLITFWVAQCYQSHEDSWASFLFDWLLENLGAMWLPTNPQGFLTRWSHS